jgi:hypothetical protein
MELIDKPPSVVQPARTVPNYLNAEEMMALLHIASRTTLQKRIDAGLKVHRVGRRLLFDPADVASFVDSRCTTPDAGQVA